MRCRQIKVIASAAVKEAVFELIPAFEKASGHKVTTIWAGTEAITKRISGGEVVGIVLIAALDIDQLIAAGKLVAGSRADVAKSAIGVAARAGLPKPDISSGEAVKNAVLAAKSVAYSSGLSGFYLADFFKKMGIADPDRKQGQDPRNARPDNECSPGAMLGGVTDVDCVFCRVVTALQDAESCPHPESGEPVRKIRGLPASIAILGQDQFYRGYTVVVAKRHAAELHELPEAESVEYYQDMVRVARAVAQAFRPRKLNYELLGNTVRHLHWHVFPRYADDPNPLRPVWEHPHPPRVAAADEAEATIAAIRRQL